MLSFPNARGCRTRFLDLAWVFCLLSSTAPAQVPTPEPSSSPKDGKPPTLVVQASPETLWPADERYVEVTVKVTVTNESVPRPTVRLVSITCNQKLDLGDDVRHAAFGTDDRVFLVKATRSIASSDRIYRITYQAFDALGNGSTATARVVVPRRAPASPASGPKRLLVAFHQRRLEGTLAWGEHEVDGQHSPSPLG